MASNESKIKKPSTAEQRDELIGRGLTKQMSAGATSICPPMEDIAALIDGGLEGEARDQLMKHLAACERCYEVFSTSKELLEVEEVPAKKSMVTLVSSVVGVAAVLIIAVTVTLQGNKQMKTDVAAVKEINTPQVQTQAALPTSGKGMPLPAVAKAEVYVPRTASDSAAMLVRAGKVGHLVESISSGSSAVYGFSGATTPDKVSFRMGVHATDLELRLRGNDREGAVSQLKQMMGLLRQGDTNRAEVKCLAEITEKLEAGEALQGFAGSTTGLEKGIVTDDERFLYRFGVWAEGGRLAAIAENKEYVTARSLNYMNNGVKGKQLPPGVINALGEIKAAVGRRGEFSEKDFLGMKRNFEDIVAMF